MYVLLMGRQHAVNNNSMRSKELRTEDQRIPEIRLKAFPINLILWLISTFAGVSAGTPSPPVAFLYLGYHKINYIKVLL